MIRHALATVLSLCIPCRHRRQSIAGRKLATGTYEMYLVCSRCARRISPGVVLGPNQSGVAAKPSPSAAGLAAANWLPE